MGPKGDREATASRASHPGRILLLDSDPYLAFIAEREFPEATIVVRGADDGIGPEELDADVVVARADDERLDTVRAAETRLVIVAEPRGTGGAATAALPTADGVLLRPFDHTEFGRTLRAVLSADWRPVRVEGVPALGETHRVLAYLHDVARAVPAGSPVSTVASALLDQAVEHREVSAGLILTEELGLLSVAASFGLSLDGDPVFSAGSIVPLLRDGPRLMDRGELPAELAEWLGSGDPWIGAPLLHSGSVLGVLLLRSGSADPDGAQDSGFVDRLASEAAGALAIARLFGRIRELAVDAERRRMAADLHDGIAQVMTHLRLELDLLTATQDLAPEHHEEVQRLGRVVQRGLADLRSIIAGLRSSVASEGLVGALGAYVRDLQSLGGPEVRFHVDPGIHLAEEEATEIFRIAQEAVSNALRHAGADAVDVTLDMHGERVNLLVEDDGRGMSSASVTGGGTGLGLDAMVERAERIGAGLSVAAGEGGRGTRVSLVYPRDVPGGRDAAVDEEGTR